MLFRSQVFCVLVASRGPVPLHDVLSRAAMFAYVVYFHTVFLVTFVARVRCVPMDRSSHVVARATRVVLSRDLFFVQKEV